MHNYIHAYNYDNQNIKALTDTDFVKLNASTQNKSV